jgi:AcrR family transcriptional regulator
MIDLPTRPLRADARRNRDRLLASASAAFAEQGDQVPLEVIAERAGVGIGTLYRHFPSREALIVAAYQQEVDATCGAASQLLRTLPGDRAFRAWAGRFASYVATKRAMGEALRSAVASDSPLFAETRSRIGAAVQVLLDAGAEDGTLRKDIEAGDVMRLLGAIWQLPPGPDWDAEVSRLLDLVVDGLRFGARPACARAPGTPEG